MTASTTDDVVGLAPVIPVVVIDDLERRRAAGRRAGARRPAGDRGDAAHAGGARGDRADRGRGAGRRRRRRHGHDVARRSPRRSPPARASSSRPGATPTLLDALQASGVPFLPGTATASDVSRCSSAGSRYAKLFPAEAVGGVDALKAFAGPFPQMRFCPTGGIDRGQRARLPGAAERGLRRRLVDGQAATWSRSRPMPRR